jgi:hypothetical protein
MVLRRSLIQSAAFLALATLAGCGSKGGNFATVSGTVTYNGAPVEGARVAFHSTVEVDGKSSSSFGAQTDSNGKYIIASIGKDPGIPPGLYKVTVAKYEGGKGPMSAEGIDQGQMDAMASDQGAIKGAGGPKNLLPAEFATVGTTKLSATLEAGKNEKVDFALKGGK